MSRYIWLVLLGVVAPTASLFADDGMGASSGGSFTALAVGIAMGVAVFAAASAQGKIAAAFMEGASRNPGAEKVIKTPLILSLVFVETLVLFTVLIAFMLIGKM